MDQQFGPPAPTPASSSAQLQRPSSYPYNGRLIVLDSGHTTGYDPFAGLSSYVAINFPMMPEDGIELGRTADYLAVNSWAVPDGIHQYKATQTLNIPINFKLHAFDKEYCPNGSLSLLQLASLLHSFTLPVTNINGTALVNTTRSQAQPQDTPDGSSDGLAAYSKASSSPYSLSQSSKSDVYPPVTLRLELIYTDESNPGVMCTGYVRDVKVRLRGPFLRGPGKSYNLPSAADFEFTFVHVPGYGNNFSLSATTTGQVTTMGQALAGDVKDKFYNTLAITRDSDQNYKGFGS